MPAKVYNSVIKRGITFERTVVLWTDNTKTTPLDLTGCDILSQMRKNVDAEEKFDFQIEFDPDRTTGRFKWRMVFSVTATLDIRDYVYDTLLLPPASAPRRLLWEGRMQAQNTVTR